MGYSLDLRKRVIALREKGEKQARIAELMGLSISTVKRYLVRIGCANYIHPQKHRGAGIKASRNQQELDRLIGLIA